MTQVASGLNCHICGEPLAFRLAHGRKSGKPFVMLRCPVDGRHFRGFIADQGFVRAFVDNLEVRADEGHQLTS